MQRLATTELARDDKAKLPSAAEKAKNLKKQEEKSYKLGSKDSKKVLQTTFKGRKFDFSNVKLLDAAGIKAAWDKIYGEGTYDGTCDACTEADGPLEGFEYGGKIYINKDDQAVDTVPHEIIHTAQSKAMDKLGSGIYEGITEYLTQKAVSGFGFKPSSSYPGQLAAIQKLAAVTSDAAIENAYFDGDVEALKKAVETHKKGAWDKFVAAMKAETYAKAKTELEE